MRLTAKIFSLPLVLITWILYGVCRMIVLASGMILGILSGMTLAAATALFFSVGIMPGIAVLAIAFLISPYGIPKMAAWFTGKLGGISCSLREFVFG